MKLLALCLIAASCACAQPAAAPDPAILDAGRKFTAELKLDPKADAALFDAVGFDRAAVLLNAVMSRGQEPSATLSDWTALHRATEGLVELHLHLGNTFKASLYAGFDEMFFRNLEHDYERALAAARLALDLQERSGVAGTLYLPHLSIARNLASLGRPEEAAVEFRRARDLCPEPYRPVAADTWRQIVSADIASGKLDSARAEARRMFDISTAAPPVFRAQALLARSDVEIASNDYTSVIDLVKQARAIVTSPADKESFDLEALNTLMTCVLASMRTLSYDEALKLAGRMDQDFTGLIYPVAPFARAAIKVRRRLAGDIEGVLKDDLDTLQKARLAKNVPGQIETLRSLAVTYSAFNAGRNRIELLEEALALEENLYPDSKPPQSYAGAWSLYRTLASLGDAYLDQHEIGKARRVFDRLTKGIDAIQSAQTRRQLDPLFKEAQLGKARVAELDDDPDAARDLLRAQRKEHPADTDVLWQYARFERNLGENPSQAADLYRAAISAARSTRNAQTEIALRLEVARYLATAGAARVPDALAEASNQIATVEVEARAVQNAGAQWHVHYVRGLIAAQSKQDDQALAEFKLAVARLESIRAALSDADKRQSFMDNEFVQDLYQRTIAILARANREGEAWQYVERAKARTFLEMLGGRSFRQSQPAPDLAPLRALEAKITDLRAQLSPEHSAVLRGAAHPPAAVESELHAAEAKFALARQQAGLGSTRAGSPLSLKPVSIEQVRRLLPARSALIEYAVLNDALAAFLVTRERSSHHLWPVNTAELNRSIRGLRALLADPNSGPAAESAARKLSTTVLDPILPAVPAGINRLIVVPAGYLNYLPFQVLPLPDGRLALDRFAITYLPSASTLEFLRDDAGGKGRMFLGALGEISVEGMAPLPGTLRETDGIAAAVPGAARASERAFTHDRARSALTEFDKVHFATHGLLDERAPLFSALLTSPAPGQPSRLSLYEITEIPVRARLVVLSACETGLGKLLGGDEVAGLTRTLLTAGASTVVSSLWKVSDDSTALLMQDFHRLLNQGTSPADAMRQAALAVRARFPHPFFWAPFIVTGAR